MSYPKQKVVFIIGTTGVGKTKLSVQLAKHYGGEIVNADIMQMYDAVPIATAKVTPEEAQGIPHHLLSFLKPTDTYTVRDYRDAAMKMISFIYLYMIPSRGKLPIVVGGTNYYIQSLLWESLLDEGTLHEEEPHKKQIIPIPGPYQLDNINNYTNEELYSILKTMDPEMSSNLHMNQKRKVRRAVEVYVTTGKKQSSIIEEQKKRFLSLESRYNARCFYLTCDRMTLYKRLDDRVDKMVEQGLLKEVEDFITNNKDLYRDLGGDLDDGDVNNHGIMQAIGLKEFIPAFTGTKEVTIENCLNQLKQNTRNYAKKQITWITNRLMPRNIYIQSLDTTDISQWDQNVYQPALQVVDSLLNTPQNLEIKNSDQWIEKNIKPVTHHYCTVCARDFCGDKDYNEHINSRKHRRAKEHLNKKNIYMNRKEYIEKMATKTEEVKTNENKQNS
ncbi:hypothetical protein WA158_001943 [Blastocystis sp. Blastoise]